MICFPNAKINIGLNITEKREDGYHNIESIFYPVPLCDALEIVVASDEQLPGFYSTGLEIPGIAESNLCVKAYNLVKEKFQLPPIAIHLHKIIPMGAGLGGGSSDGANALILLNKLFDLNLSHEELKNYALQLGSDCPFFIDNKPAYVLGRGEVMQNTELDLTGWHLVLVHPSIHVSTKSAYDGIVPAYSNTSLQMEVLYNRPNQWKGKIANQFEETVFKNHPEIESIKAKLHRMGAAYAAMSGSGSSVYGLFQEEVKEVSTYFPSLFTWQGLL